MVALQWGLPAFVTIVLCFCGLVPRVVRLIGSSYGRVIRSRTGQRRDQAIDRASEAKRNSNTAGVKDNTSSDDDWEEVDGTAEPTKSRIPENSDWDGIVGFFHPFWYA